MVTTVVITVVSGELEVVKDGGSGDNNHSEPNGDYSGNGFLRIYGGSRPNGTNISTSMGYNDGGAYGIGSRYLLSTNTKT